MPSAAIIPRKIFRRSLNAREHNFASFFREFDGIKRVEHKFAAGGTRAGREAACDFVGFFAESRSKIGAKTWASESAGMRFTASSLEISRSFTISTADLDGCEAGAFPIPGLEDVQAIFFDRELDILHILEMIFQEGADFLQFLVGGGHFPCKLGHGVWRAHPGDDILSLRIDEILAVKYFFARRGITGKGHTCGAGVAHVSKYHCLDIDGGAPLVGEFRICGDTQSRGHYSRSRKRHRRNPTSAREGSCGKVLPMRLFDEGLEISPPCF